MSAKKPKASAKKSTFESTLEDIHVSLAEELLKRIQNGAATAADLNVARAYLKDNGIEGSPETHVPLRELAETLPFAAEA